MSQPPQTPGPSGASGASGAPSGDTWGPEAVKLAFQEYRFVAEDTAKISDRRQTVNTLFVSINALFLTGAGYLLLQVLNATAGASNQRLILSAIGFLAIALITSRLNSAWLRLGNQYRRLVNLRMRYLHQLEEHMRLGEAALFPPVSVPLREEEIKAGGAKEYVTRGTYSLEDVLYVTDNKRDKFGFTEAEKLIGRTMTQAYWLAFAVVLVIAAVNFSDLHVSLGPIHF